MSRAVVQCVCVWIVVEVLCACGGNLETVIQSTDGDNTGCSLVLISFNEIYDEKCSLTTFFFP